jgi:ribosome-binding protein aMBF1 (putative translation factor)
VFPLQFHRFRAWLVVRRLRVLRIPDPAPRRRPRARRPCVSRASDRDPEFNRAVGSNIRRARKAAGVRQCDLAEAIGYARPEFCRVEHGQQAIDIRRFLLLAAVLVLPAISLLPETR